MGLKQKGILIVLSGPSGAGKDSVLREIFKTNQKDVKLSISYTTRQPRPGEVNGKDYYFVSEEEFLNLVSNGKMLEYATYCENYYGTPLCKIEEDLTLGKSVILEIEVQGAKQIIEKCPEAVSIFIAPPSISALRSRLASRGLDSAETIENRILEAKREIIYAKNYNYIVVNDDLQNCANEILKIIDVEHLKSCRRNNIIEEVLKNGKSIS